MATEPNIAGLDIAGARFLPGLLSVHEQIELAGEIAAIMAEAPLFRPRMPRNGRPFSVSMTNCGALGWVSDESGYRYQSHHPVTGRCWPALPGRLAALWQRVTGLAALPEACLVNYYDGHARMGLHQDRDEADFRAPVLSLSLGDSALFRIGGTARGGPTRSVTLASGDGLVLEGASRLAFHGIDRIRAGSSRLLPQGGRINLTLRRVTPLPDDGG
ncbi:alpha-ketoglutarate-dependent dioxygenase AlkB [Pseudoxanthobacter sp.]|uniref:alpha-ketoglutarate-dependent dioxygenase AlkB family protein n=1 Tax=Pseudoxanthobacter sp. TaxID=1925742 RepID=UPI002FDF5B18